MEVVAHMSVEESEIIAQYFQDSYSDFVSCFDSSCYSSNEGINNSKSIKRKCEIENECNSSIEFHPKKARIFTMNAWEENEGMNDEKNHHDSSSCLSENDSIEKSRMSDSTRKNTKHRLYARNRRERINQRLRTLQKLIPNGTKVDISTMLEEAYQYVKFMQLQIKLLCSNELWMYAPIAFNGTNNGLSVDISQA